MATAWRQFGRKGRLIRHRRYGAACAVALTPGMLTVVVIQASCLTPLIAGVGGAQLFSARAVAALGSTVALAAVTMRAEKEPGLAVRRMALQFEQDGIFSMAGRRHAPAAQALDNRKPFLSPL